MRLLSASLIVCSMVLGAEPVLARFWTLAVIFAMFFFDKNGSSLYDKGEYASVGPKLSLWNVNRSIRASVYWSSSPVDRAALVASNSSANLSESWSPGIVENISSSTAVRLFHDGSLGASLGRPGPRFFGSLRLEVLNSRPEGVEITGAWAEDPSSSDDGTAALFILGRGLPPSLRFRSARHLQSQCSRQQFQDLHRLAPQRR